MGHFSQVRLTDLSGAYSPPPSNPPAAKFASQGDAHMRAYAQIKFLYYPLYIFQNLRTLLPNKKKKFSQVLAANVLINFEFYRGISHVNICTNFVGRFSTCYGSIPCRRFPNVCSGVTLTFKLIVIF